MPPPSRSAVAFAYEEARRAQVTPILLTYFIYARGKSAPQAQREEVDIR